MNKKIIFAVVILLFLVFFSFNASAETIPSTSPCRVIGMVNIEGSAASDGLTVSAVPSESLEKSAATSGGNYNLNAIGATDGETVTLYVCGISTGTTFAFVPYCKTSDTEPWIIKNIDLELQPDGERGCTCAGICSGGHCVNAGTTGVCSSNDYYCDSDGTCESAFGETTSTCSADCHSGGGGTGGGSTYTPPVSETPPNQTIPPGGSANYIFSKSAIFGVTEIDVTVKAGTAGTFTVNDSTRPSGVPYAISSTDGSVYKYMEITSTILNSNIETATIKFKVSKSWILSNNIDPDRVFLKKLVNNEWIELPTTRTGEDSSYYFYETTVSSFSMYAIVGYNRNAPITTPAITPTPTSTPTSTTPPAATPTPSKPLVPQTPVVKPENKLPIWLLVIFLIGAFMVIIVLSSTTFKIWNHEHKARQHNEKAMHHKEHALKFTEVGDFEKALMHQKASENNANIARGHLKDAAYHHHKMAKVYERKGNHINAEKHRQKAKHHESKL